jgi:hypothetical protein
MAPRSLIVVSAVLMLAPCAVHAVEVSLSGQINRLLMQVNNGDKKGLVNADNSVSGTRFRFTGSGELENGMTAGVIYETQLESNPTNKIDADNLNGDGVGGNVGEGDYFNTRYQNVWIKGDFGKITLGQGSSASDNSAQIDNSGTSVIQYSGADSDLLGDMEFGDSGVTVNDVRSDYDGLGRNDNLRYDAAIGDFLLSASLGNGYRRDAAVLYEIEQFTMKFAVWDRDNSGNGKSGAAVSASWNADNGINLTGSYSGESTSDDPTNVYLKLGFKHGKNAYAIDWSETRDRGPGDSSSYSIAWVGSMMQGVELYATYRVQTLDDVSGADDIDALAGGARIKF